MAKLLRKINYRNIILDYDTAGETVPVRLDSGELREVIWLGLIERDDALAKQKGGNIKPVKIKVHSYRAGDFGDWVAFQETEYLQGCLVIGAGVFGVLVDGKPRVIN